MTIAGMIIMAISVTLVVLLFAWCVTKVLTVQEDPSEHLHGFEKETPDVEHPKKKGPKQDPTQG